MYNIFIAKDYNSYPMGLVLAKDEEVAKAFFTGKYGTYNSIEKIDPSTIEYTISGVPCFNIIETSEYQESYESPSFRIIGKR